MNRDQRRRGTQLLERNLQALTAHQRFSAYHAAALVRASGLSRRVRIEPSRSGGDQEPTAAMVSSEHCADGSKAAGRYLHSRYRPVHEAQKTAAGTDPCDYLLLLGLGLGYEAEALLARYPLLELRVIEPDPELLRTALTTRGLESLLSSPRFGLICNAEPEEAAHALDYQAFFFPQLRTVRISARVAEDSEYFKRFARGVEGYISAIGADYRACAAYGHRWCTNTVRNLGLLPVARQPTFLFDTQAELSIIAAGPSADRALRRKQPESTLICDTALRSARQVIGGQLHALTIDPQSISMMHYLGVPTSTVSCCADLGAHNRLVRRFATRSFVSSAHPLHCYLRDAGLSIGPALVQAGNVADTAIRLAAHLGAQRVSIHGLDFAYQAERAYISGSFIDSYLFRGSNRLRSSGSLNYEFLRKQNATRLQGSPFYRNELLLEYWKTFQSTVDELGYRFVGSEDAGTTLRYELDSSRARAAVSSPPPETPSTSSWKSIVSVLTGLATRLQSIPKSPAPNDVSLYQWFVSLDTAAARTVLPTAIHFHERAALPRHEALQAAIGLMLHEILELISTD